MRRVLLNCLVQLLPEYWSTEMFNMVNIVPRAAVPKVDVLFSTLLAACDLQAIPLPKSHPKRGAKWQDCQFLFNPYPFLLCSIFLPLIYLLLSSSHVNLYSLEGIICQVYGPTQEASGIVFCDTIII